MARERRQVQAPKPQVEGKFYIILATVVMFGSLAFFIAIFGADFGIIAFERQIDASVLPWVFAAMCIYEYAMDIRYAKRLHYYTSEKESFQDWIPIWNSIQTTNGPLRIAIYTLLGLAGVTVLLIITPLIMIVPESIRLNFASIGTNIEIGYFIVFCGIRGYEQLSIQKVVMGDYLKLYGRVNNGGGTKFTNIAQNLFYFLPILRSVRLTQDIQFMTTVKMTIEENNRLE